MFPTCFCLLDGPAAETSFGPKHGSVDPQPGFGPDVVEEEPDVAAAVQDFLLYFGRTRNSPTAQIVDGPMSRQLTQESKVTPQEDVMMLVSSRHIRTPSLTPAPPVDITCFFLYLIGCQRDTDQGQRLQGQFTDKCNSITDNQ